MKREFASHSLGGWDGKGEVGGDGGKGGHERGCELKTVANGKPAPVNPTPEEFVLRRLSSSTVIRSGTLTGRKGSDWDGRSAFRSCDSKSFNS